MKATPKTRYSLRKLFETRKRNISVEVDTSRRKSKVMARAVKTEGVKSGVRRMRGRPRTRDAKNRNSRKRTTPSDMSQRATSHAVAREGSLSPAQREPPQLELMPAVEEDSDISLMFPSFISIDDHLSPGKCILLCPSTSCRKRFSNPIELVSHLRNLHRTSNNFESSLSQKGEKNSLVVYACPICRHTQFSTHTTSSDLVMLSEHADRYHGKSLLPSDFSYFCSILFDPVNKEVSASERIPTNKEPDVFYLPCRSERNYSPILPLLPHSSTNYLEPAPSYGDPTSHPEASSRLSPRPNILFRNLKAPTDACANTLVSQASRASVVTHSTGLTTTPVSPVPYSSSLRESPVVRTSAALNFSTLRPLATPPTTVTTKAPTFALARSHVRPLLTMPTAETSTVVNTNIPVLALASSAQIPPGCPLYVPASPAKAPTLLLPSTPISPAPPPASSSSSSSTITTTNSFVGDSKKGLLRDQVPVLTPQKPDPNPSTTVDAAIATFHQLIQSTYPTANPTGSVGGGSRAPIRSPHIVATSPSSTGHSQPPFSKRPHLEWDRPLRQVSSVTVPTASEATAMSTPVLTGLSFLQPLGLAADNPCSLVEHQTSGTLTAPKTAKFEDTSSSAEVNGSLQTAVPPTACAQQSALRQSVNGSSLENALTCSAASMVDWESDCQLSPTSATYGLYTLATLSVRQAAEFAEKSTQKKTSAAQESVVPTSATFTSDWSDSTSARLFEGSNIVGVERIPLSISPNAPVDTTPKQQGPHVLPVVRGRNRRLLPRKFNKCAVIEPSSSQSSISTPETVVTTSPSSNSIVCLARGPLKSGPVGILSKVTSANHSSDLSCGSSETPGRKRCLPPLAVKPPREANTTVLQRPTLITIRPAVTSEAASSSPMKVMEISPLSIGPGGLQSPRMPSTSSSTRTTTARDSDTLELSKASITASSRLAAAAAATGPQSTASSEPDKRAGVVNPLISIMCESGDHASTTSSLVVTQPATAPTISAYAATPILLEPLQAAIPPTSLDSIRTYTAVSESPTTTGLERTAPTDSLTPSKPTAAPTILPISLSHNGLPFVTPNRLSGVQESTVTVTSVPIRPAAQSTVKLDDKAVPLMTAILANVPLHPPARAKLLTSNAYVTVQPRPPTYRTVHPRSTHLQKILPRPQQLPPASSKETSSSRTESSASWPASQAGESTSLSSSIKVSIFSPSLPATTVVSTHSQQMGTKTPDLPPPSAVVATTQAVNGSSISAASTPPPTTASPRDRTQLSPKVPTYLLLRSTPVTDGKAGSNQPDTLAGSSV